MNWHNLFVMASPYIIMGGIGLLSIIIIKIIAVKKVNVSYIESHFDFVKTFLHSKFGERGDSIINLWSESLKKVQDSDGLTNAEATDIFIKYIDDILKLNQEEMFHIKALANHTIVLASQDPVSTENKSIKIMSV